MKRWQWITVVFGIIMAASLFAAIQIDQLDKAEIAPVSIQPVPQPRLPPFKGNELLEPAKKRRGAR